MVETMTHKERMLRVMRGETVDKIPFVPRLDLWWLANAFAGKLPEKFRGMKPDDIARAHGWACYHMVPDFTNMMSGPDDILHRALGLFQFKQSVYRFRFAPDVEVRTRVEDGLQVIEYHTPKGMVRTVGGHTEEMKKKGASLGWTREHLVKGPEDIEAAAYLFETITVEAQFDGARAYADSIGDDGVVAVGGASLAASPMHHVQKELIDQTRFFFEYKDNLPALERLAAAIEVYFEKVLRVLEDSPAEVVLWGANYDDTITWPPFFEKQILPWLTRATERLHARGKIVATHTDGENRRLMDLIPRAGADVAESLTPWPMTQVRIEEYYRRWDRMTLMGCIPECMLLCENTSDEAFESFLDDLFKNLRPGNRLILGVADSTPPNAVFERLDRIGERVEREGRLPL